MYRGYSRSNARTLSELIGWILPLSKQMNLIIRQMCFNVAHSSTWGFKCVRLESENFSQASKQFWPDYLSDTTNDVCFSYRFMRLKYYKLNQRRVGVQHFINGDSLSQWKKEKYDPTESKPPLRLPKNMAQLITSERCPLWQFCENPSTGSFSANEWNIISYKNAFSYW